MRWIPLVTKVFFLLRVLERYPMPYQLSWMAWYKASHLRRNMGCMLPCGLVYTQHNVHSCIMHETDVIVLHHCLFVK